MRQIDIIYHVLNLLIRVYVSKVLRATLGIIDLLHAFFLGFQHFNYWRPGSKIYSAVLAVNPKMLTPRVRLRSITLRLMEDTVDGSEILRETQLRLVVSPIFYRVFIHSWLFGFFHQQ